MIGVPNTPSNATNPPLVVTMYATAPGRTRTRLGEFTFEYRRLDKNNHSAIVAASGIRGCEHNGTIEDEESADGTAEFDGFITCDCQSVPNLEYGGPNCNDYIEPAAASDRASDSGTTVGGVLGGVVALMLGVLLSFRVQVYRLKHRPLDVTGMQQRVMQSLGASGQHRHRSKRVRHHRDL